MQKSLLEWLKQHVIGKSYSTGARAVEVALLLEQAGFTEIKIDTRLGQIHNAQRSGLGWKRALLRLSEHRYAISARKE